MCCEKCGKTCGWLLLVFGLLFLLQDLGVWDFWGLSWYTIGFLLFGLGAVGMMGCKECCEVKEAKAPAKKK